MRLWSAGKHPMSGEPEHWQDASVPEPSRQLNGSDMKAASLISSDVGCVVVMREIENVYYE